MISLNLGFTIQNSKGLKISRSLYLFKVIFFRSDIRQEDSFQIKEAGIYAEESVFYVGYCVENF